MEKVNGNEHLPTNPPEQASKNHIKVFLIVFNLILFLILVVIFILHFKGVGYKLSSTLSQPITHSNFFKKDSPSNQIKTITYENNFITPRKILIPDISVCVNDKDSLKPNVKLPTQKSVNLTSKIWRMNKDISGQNTIWLYPFSTLSIDYSTKGEFYDYVYQYLDYDQLVLNSDCEDGSDNTTLETISFDQSDCFGCINKQANGPDIAIIDFITNDNKIWHDGHLAFIPIIKNIGTEPTGPFKVTYKYLNGQSSNYFELDNLIPGEIVNNSIAGKGFGGNFDSKFIKPEMEVELDVQLTARKDVNLANNAYKWKFQYSYTPLPKHSCKYSDNNIGPEDFYSATSINYGDKTFYDICVDERNLFEYLCDQHPVYNGDDGIKVFLYNCPQGCLKGACQGDYTQFQPQPITDPKKIGANDPANSALQFGLASKVASAGHSAIIHDDKMYVYGGFNLPDKYLNTLRIYNFETGEWSQGPTNVNVKDSYEQTSALHEDKIYVYSKRKLSIFNLLTNSWSEGKLNPYDTDGIFGRTAVVYKDKMYLYGGSQTDYAKNLFVYDFTSDTWQKGLPSPENLPSHVSHSAVVYDSKMYIFGGNPLTGKESWTNTMLIYDFEKGTWSEGKPDNLTKGRYGHTATVVGNKMYIYGGIDGESNSHLSDSVHVYNFITKTWSKLGNISTIFRVHGHSAVEYKNKLYIVGGERKYFDRDFSPQLIIMDLN